MRFTVHCDIDGAVEVALDDIESVVLRTPETADVSFRCPVCGGAIEAVAVIPPFLGEALRAVLGTPEDSASMFGFEVVALDGPTEVDIDSRVELFRRQLEHVDSVEDILAEIDRAHGNET